MTIDLASIQQRVKTCGLFVQVHDVESLADAVRNPGSYAKQAFVVLPKETAEPNKLMGGHRQRVSARIAVSFNVQAQAIAPHRHALVEPLRSAVKNWLAGWTPTGAETALDYAYSDISSIQNGFIWVNVFFDCKYLFAPDPQP
jgi:hypothetical protein